MLKGFRKISRFLAVILLATSFTPLTPYAQDANKAELERLEREKKTHENREQELSKQAQSAQKEIDALNQKLVQAAERQRMAEAIAEQSEKRLFTLRKLEHDATAQFETQKAALQDVIVALIAIEKDRPPALAVSPENATEAARVAILMGLIAPQLNARADAISKQIGQLHQVRQDLLMGNQKYKEATINLENARKTTSVLIGQRRVLIEQLNQQANIERAKIAEIAAKASSIRDLIAKIGQAIPNAIANANLPQGFSNTKGNLMSPANGVLVQRFGEKLPEGGTSGGITIRTRQSAQVLSPYDGRVEFAAPFRAYGRLLIINVGESYRVVLAGMSNTYVEQGQEILSGEPIGKMSEDARVTPDLYMEIRKDNDTLNPIEWLKIANK